MSKKITEETFIQAMSQKRLSGYVDFFGWVIGGRSNFTGTEVITKDNETYLILKSDKGEDYDHAIYFENVEDICVKEETETEITYEVEGGLDWENFTLHVYKPYKFGCISLEDFKAKISNGNYTGKVAVRTRLYTGCFEFIGSQIIDDEVVLQGKDNIPHSIFVDEALCYPDWIPVNEDDEYEIYEFKENVDVEKRNTSEQECITLYVRK